MDFKKDPVFLYLYRSHLGLDLVDFNTYDLDWLIQAKM